MLFPRKAVGIADGANLDSFSRLRVSEPQAIFDAQFTYGLQPLLFEQISSGASATVEHDADNRLALMEFTAAATDSQIVMQTFEHFRYQPGKSQLVFVTFNMVEAADDVIKFAGYSDGTNGIEFRMNGSEPQFLLASSTDAGDQKIAQDDWNLDPLDGTGPSGITIDFTKTQIFVIDLQALYVGRVRVGFDIDGVIVYAHQFRHANRIAAPYMATANLPIRAGMVNSGSADATTSMHFICCSVSSEGGVDDTAGYAFSVEGTVTASSGARTHALSIQPAATFNSIANRTRFVLESVDVIVTGNQPVLWELVIGQSLTGTTTFADVNATYSAMQFNTAGTLSGDPAVVIARGYVAATAQQKTATSTQVPFRYPITLNAAGAARVLGRLTVLVTGIGGTSATRAVLNWKEIR